MNDVDTRPFPNVGNNVFYNKEFSIGQMIPQIPLSDNNIIKKDIGGEPSIWYKVPQIDDELETITEENESDDEKLTKITKDDLNKYSKKNFGTVLAKFCSKNPDRYDEEVKKFKNLIHFCKEKEKTAPEKVSFKEILKSGHKAGLRGAAGGAIGGTYAAVGSANKYNNENFTLTKNQCKYYIKDLEKNLNDLESNMKK